MLLKPHQCSGCSFEAKGQSYCPGKGPLTAPVAILGQGPGRDESYRGEPFVGAAGRRLDIWLAKASIPRSLCWIGNGMNCWYKVRGKEAAPLKAIAECYQRCWGPTLHSMPNLGKPNSFIVTFGTEVSRFLLGNWYSERAAGSVIKVTLPPLEGI